MSIMFFSNKNTTVFVGMERKGLRSAKTEENDNNDNDDDVNSIPIHSNEDEKKEQWANLGNVM